MPPSPTGLGGSSRRETIRERGEALAVARVAVYDDNAGDPSADNCNPSTRPALIPTAHFFLSRPPGLKLFPRDARLFLFPADRNHAEPEPKEAKRFRERGARPR